MANEEVVLQNFAAGELSPKMLGRFELPVHKSGCRRLRNFIAETQGPARYRPGFKLVHYTRQNQEANLIPFQFNDEQSYMLEFTDQKLRFHKDEGVIVEADIAISSVTKANPGVVTTSASHGLSNGDEVFISDAGGMLELNGKSYIVANKTGTTFELTNIDGDDVDTTNYGTHTASSGVVNKIYELTTPYQEELDLFALKVAQNADVMYINHPYYEPRKLTRTAHTSWSLSLYTRTSDPFLDAKTITGVTQASPGVVTSAGHGLADGDIIIIEGIVGMTELNSRVYEVNYINANTFSLIDYITGVAVNTSSYTAYSSDGYASLQELLPSALGFYEGRLYHSGIGASPAQFIGSRSPVSTTGVPRYDDYTAGADADHAVYFTIADGEVNHVEWLMGTNRLLMAGTFGTEVRITGETLDKAITPTSVNVRPENRLGVADVTPVNKENIIIYVQRGALTVRSFEFDALADSFVSVDRNLVADHITESGIKQIAWQTGRPDILWCVRNDGKLIGLTFKSREEISGWHLHDTGDTEDDTFFSIGSMPRPNKGDQIWVVTERVVNSVQRRFVEFMTDEPNYPDLKDYYTGEANYETDYAQYVLAMQEAQKEHVHLDCALTYDGSLPGLNAGATISPSAITGDSIVITSDVNIFVNTDIGREIWKKSIDGVGTGRALITARPDAQHVTCQVIDDFDSTDEMAPGDWYITTDNLSTLDHLEGREISIVADGGEHPSATVVGGEVTLDYQASVIHVGIPYLGHLEPMSVEAGGTTGPAQAKNKHVTRVGVRFLNSAGASVGSDMYNTEEISFTDLPLQIGSSQVLYSGVKTIAFDDAWNIDKTVFIRQDKPLPCTVLFLEVWTETDND